MSKEVRAAVAIAVLVLLVLLYVKGTFDTILVHVGLNARPCIQNIYGSVYCGEARENFEGEMQRVQGSINEYNNAVEQAAREGR